VLVTAKQMTVGVEVAEGVTAVAVEGMEEVEGMEVTAAVEGTEAAAGEAAAGGGHQGASVTTVRRWGILRETAPSRGNRGRVEGEGGAGEGGGAMSSFRRRCPSTRFKSPAVCISPYPI